MDKYFIYDPDGGGFETFETFQERDDVAREIIDLYKEDGEWIDSVESVVCGMITKKVTECDIVSRPKKLTADNFDDDGQYWAEGIDHICNYKMVAI